MIGFLIFYYIFSVLFMLGYGEFKDCKGLLAFLAVILVILAAPVMMPINLGYYINKRS